MQLNHLACLLSALAKRSKSRSAALAQASSSLSRFLNRWTRSSFSSASFSAPQFCAVFMPVYARQRAKTKQNERYKDKQNRASPESFLGASQPLLQQRANRRGEASTPEQPPFAVRYPDATDACRPSRSARKEGRRRARACDEANRDKFGNLREGDFRHRVGDCANSKCREFNYARREGQGSNGIWW